MKISGRVVTPDGVRDGRIDIHDGRIAAIEPTTDHSGRWLIPGFVDIHVHGGGGASFTTGDVEQAYRAALFHLAHGTTTLLASLVSAPYELMRSATKAYAPLVGDGILGGIHFEGPYLSAARCGAQNPAYLRDPSADELRALIDLGVGTLRMVTLAPERPGALAAIDLLARHGVAAAIGHTDATYEQTKTAIAAGARIGTHVFNGMRPPHHREPGPVFALLGAPSVICEFIPDGHHLHDGTLEFALSAVGMSRAAVVTDALSATGMPDGPYELGGQTVTVRDGLARLNQGDTLAGSTLTMDAALRRLVERGLSIVDVCRMTSTTPAAALGRSDIGALAPGRRADLVELSDDLTVLRVMRRGRWL